MNKILAGFFLILVAGLLIAARFGFEWAGGEGVAQALPARIEAASGSVTIERDGRIRAVTNNNNLSRGEIIRTGDDAKATVKIGERIWAALDERTDISLESLSPTRVELKITRGRILAKTSGETDELVVSTPVSSGSINSGLLSVVRYDWLDKTNYAPLASTVFVSMKDNPEEYEETSIGAIEAIEKDPFSLSYVWFNWEDQNAADFYEWAWPQSQPAAGTMIPIELHSSEQ